MPVQNNNHANLPIIETTFFILLNLSSVPKHGYAIITQVEAFSDNWVVFSKRNSCSRHKRLLDRNCIEQAAELRSVGTGRARKAKKLIHQEQRVLDAELQSWACGWLFC